MGPRTRHAKKLARRSRFAIFPQASAPAKAKSEKIKAKNCTALGSALARARGLTKMVNGRRTRPVKTGKPRVTRFSTDDFDHAAWATGVQRAPVPRQELGQAPGRMIRQTGEHVGEPGLGIDVVELGGLDNERIDCSCPVGLRRRSPRRSSCFLPTAINRSFCPCRAGVGSPLPLASLLWP